MRTYDQRFKPTATAEHVDELSALAVGSKVVVRAIVFVKRSMRLWDNDFRASMTTTEVASCLVDGDYTIIPPAAEACEVPCGANVCTAYNRCQLTYSRAT